MDQPAQQTAEMPVPSAGRVVVGALPGAVVAALGIPLLAWWLLDDAGDARVSWWPVPLLALIGLVSVLGHYAKAPRPEGKTRTERKQFERALSAIPRKGPAPEDPLVRRVVVSAACGNIEALVFAGAFLIGAGLGSVIRPEFSWFGASGGAIGVAMVAAFQLRRYSASFQTLHARDAAGDARRIDPVPVPTVNQVLVHSAPAVLVLAAGLPLVLQWSLDGHGDALGDWAQLAPILLITVARVLLELVHAPRPRIDLHVDRDAMQRWLIFASVSRRLPENPRTRATAGAFACEQLETAVLMLAGVAGLIATAVIRSSPWWAVLGALIVLIAMVQVVRARRGWIYLQLLHTSDRTR